MKIAGTFSGIGGLELPFHGRDEHETVLLCDVWEASQAVLQDRFDCPVVGDIADVAETGLPDGTEVLTAGFPCTDLSQAGRTAGIRGEESGQVRHVFTLLKKTRSLNWLVLENVRNMLVLDGGDAMRYLTEELDSLGFRWAYRLVDSRFTGIPQRRQRVILVASRSDDPRDVLFTEDAGERPPNELLDNAFGFYWTEGLRGVGWAQDAVPPLKGGSSLGIPSPPAIWVPGAKPGRQFGKPTIEHAEALQGFEPGWTEAAATGRSNSPRWKLVGNAVTVGVGDWIADRLSAPGDGRQAPVGAPVTDRWPAAAYGDAQSGALSVDVSMYPRHDEYVHLTDLIDVDELVPLSARASSGFLERAHRSSLNFADGFLEALADHASTVADADAA